ncbi:MAG: hypothetical protein QXU21_05295 [Candidatus Bathyarchaeia archaeon]
MNEEKKKGSYEKSLKLDLTSKFWRTSLTLLAALLTFAGPTYVVLVLFNVLEINYAVSMVTGFVLFVAGLALMWYLIKKKIIS